MLSFFSSYWQKSAMIDNAAAGTAIAVAIAPLATPPTDTKRLPSPIAAQTRGDNGGPGGGGGGVRW